MKKSINTTLAALLVSSVALGAVATVATFVSVDAAHAKSDKASDRSSGNRGKSGEARGYGKSSSATSFRDRAGNGSNRAVANFFSNLTRKESRPTKSDRASASPSARQVGGDEGALHPSELGNMNGALNANINAVLAHIRNGNENGPVGHVAVLAAASASADGAQEILDRAALFDAVVDSPYESLEGYYAALEGVSGNQIDLEIEGAEDQDAAAVAAGFDSYEDYLSKLAVEAAQPDEGIDGVLADLGVDIENRDEVPADLALDSSDPQVADAQESLEDELAAEERILAYWNKNPGGELDPETGLTADEERLLAELNDRFTEEDRAAVLEAVEAAGVQTETDSEVCESESDVCLQDDEVVLILE